MGRLTTDIVTDIMKDNRQSSPTGRRTSQDRRNVKPAPPASKERRGQTILREADVFEIPLPPLKGARDRRAGSRRGGGSGTG